jgi:hypothetical protein
VAVLAIIQKLRTCRCAPETLSDGTAADSQDSHESSNRHAPTPQNFANLLTQALAISR